MFLFGVTWVFGAFTIRGGGPDFFKYLFVGFNSLQGVFIFVFFVVLAKESQDLWLQTCGCKEKKKREKLMSAITGIVPPKRERLGLDEDAERLKPMEEIDMEARLALSSFDITFAVQPTQFDVMLNANSALRSGALEELMEADTSGPLSVLDTPEPLMENGPRLLEHSDNTYSQDLESSSLDQKTYSLSDKSLYKAPSLGHSPTHSLDSAQNAMECMSMADSGILMEKGKRTPSPPLTLQHPQSGSTPHHHVHSVSIGYISAGSSMETLPQRDEDCYTSKMDMEPITLAPSLRPRAVPNEYARVHVEELYS